MDEIRGSVKQAIANLERARDLLKALVAERGGPSDGETADTTLENSEVAFDEIVGALDAVYRVEDRLA